MVERGSTHHSGRVDDVLADEVEALVRSGSEPRARDDRTHEPAGDDEPLPDVRIAGEDRPMPGILDLDEIEARSMLATSLRPRAFPADRDALRVVALDEHAPPDVLEALDALPEGIRFVNVQQVWEALGGEREHRDGTTAVAAPVEPEAAIEPEPLVEQRVEPIDVEIEIELEAEAVAATTAATAAAEPVPAASSVSSPASKPWWSGPVRAGARAAAIPLRASAGALRFARDRLARH